VSTFFLGLFHGGFTPPGLVAVTHWGGLATAGLEALPAGTFVMVGSASVWNYLMTGLLQRMYPFSQSITTYVLSAELEYPSGFDWIKGLFGQRVIR
jgi:hypothetical protein